MLTRMDASAISHDRDAACQRMLDLMKPLNGVEENTLRGVFDNLMQNIGESIFVVCREEAVQMLDMNCLDGGTLQRIITRNVGELNVNGEPHKFAAFTESFRQHSPSGKWEDWLVEKLEQSLGMEPGGAADLIGHVKDGAVVMSMNGTVVATCVGLRVVHGLRDVWKRLGESQAPGVVMVGSAGAEVAVMIPERLGERHHILCVSQAGASNSGLREVVNSIFAGTANPRPCPFSASDADETEVPCPPAAAGRTEGSGTFQMENTSRQTTESQLHDVALLLGGVTMRRRPYLRFWQHVARLCYVVLIALASVTWMVLHSYFVIWRGDSDLTLKMQHHRYPSVYAVAFCLPSVDGVVNLLFAHLEVHYPWRSEASAVEGEEALALSLRRDKVLKFALWTTCALVAFRFLCLFSYLHWGLWLLLGALIEVLPHLAPFLVMYGHTTRMAARLEEIQAKLLENQWTPKQCIEEYTKFDNHVRRRSNLWQFFIVLSVGMEVYIVVFQTLWSVPTDKYMPESASLSATSLTLIEGCYMVFKLWPLVRYNEKVSHFANHLLFRVQIEEDKAEDSEFFQHIETDNFRRAVWTTSMLFSTRPPCLTIFAFAVNKVTIMAMISSVTFAAVSRQFWKVAKL